MVQILIRRLAVGLLATSMIGAHAEAGQQPQQANSGEQLETAKRQTVHHAPRSKYRKARKNVAKRGEYRPNYQQNAVEVINGSSAQRVVFDEDQKSVEAEKGEPSQLKVEVMNGNSTDTRYFHLDPNAPQTEVAITKQQVVVGIQSSDTRFAGSNQHPVVTGITSAGQNDATSVGSGGQKLMNGVAPQPKRPQYEPH